MDALLRVDLGTLRTDAVLVYATRVAQLQQSPATALSPEKLQLLFVLSQKILRWFLIERRELERLNHTLQETLVEALQVAERQANEPDDTDNGAGGSIPAVSPAVFVGTHEIAVQMETVETIAIASETVGIQTDARAELLDEEVQTDRRGELLDHETQTDATAEPRDPRKDLLDCMVQADAGSELLDGETQPQDPSPRVAVESGVQTEMNRITETAVQTDAVATINCTTDVVECCMQTETLVSSELVECGVQAVVETDVVDGSMQTLPTAPNTVDGETQATATIEVKDQMVSTHDDDGDVDQTARSETGTKPLVGRERQVVDTAALAVKRQPPALEIYFQVQRSVIRLQRIVRGFVTRRRFYRMLTELVNAK